ncbi:hypothetical protein PR048_031232 [Dryococelus australis]|uniref:Amino acid transporter transmembrane domain-containing protein n=1 Tax=Dryococelus australis TaxID=614101 RepID=A0ABQ9G7F6_9NEOP|nr:hypothetical protein PR048_031232 [Dryococelus australis]
MLYTGDVDYETFISVARQLRENAEKRALTPQEVVRARLIRDLEVAPRVWDSQGRSYTSIPDEEEDLRCVLFDCARLLVAYSLELNLPITRACCGLCTRSLCRPRTASVRARLPFYVPSCVSEVKRSRELVRAKRIEYEAAPECKGRGKREIPEKTRLTSGHRPATIHTCENPGVNRQGTEPEFPETYQTYFRLGAPVKIKRRKASEVFLRCRRINAHHSGLGVILVDLCVGSYVASSKLFILSMDENQKEAVRRRGEGGSHEMNADVRHPTSSWVKAKMAAERRHNLTAGAWRLCRAPVSSRLKYIEVGAATNCFLRRVSFDRSADDECLGRQCNNPALIRERLWCAVFSHRRCFATVTSFVAVRSRRYLESLIHLLKGNIGSGLFAMGDGFHNAGLVVAPIMTLVLGVICVHSQHLLVSSLPIGCSRIRQTSNTRVDWAALNYEVLRDDEGEKRRNGGEGKTGDLRESPPTNGLVRHDSHLRKSGDPAGD